MSATPAPPPSRTAPRAALPGPSRTITVEPVRQPARAPVPAPPPAPREAPERKPEREPARI
jgi:hypothetical protein